jgi:hypothetical protein
MNLVERTSRGDEVDPPGEEEHRVSDGQHLRGIVEAGASSW